MSGDCPIKLSRLTRFGLTTPDPDALAAFYEQAFGCRPVSRHRLSGPAFEALMGVRGGADRLTFTLGHDIIECMAFDEPGRPYPLDSSADSAIFQHFAIVVARMDDAYSRLSAIKGWTAISHDGPQRLPETSGGVTAFKFRDPDGHPLELLEFPEGAIPSHWRDRGSEVCLGVDHSAITVHDTRASLAFYRGLGFRLTSRTLNVGPEQGRLDGLSSAQVEVSALAPSQSTPHLELLDYRTAGFARQPRQRANDVAASRLMFAAAAEAEGMSGPIKRFDPDGHCLIIQGSGEHG